ncbi:RDD family protein [Demequina sediminicola]|uniref:RDD family protein n=1 Tax=Demequina sediminicola TaxID=1095026 RepID=UPI0007851FC1|nr:RDD family protein [Demequina sediminicola]
MDDDEIIIGEGVSLSTGAAPVTLRMLSGAIDVFVYGVTAALAMTGLSAVVGPVVNEAAWAAILIATLVLWLGVLPALVETLTRGYSLGHLALGLRMVRDDGGPLSFRHSFIRSFVGIVEIYATFGMVAITVSTLSARGKRLGDMLAGTYAMRVRGAPRALPPIAMPPQLAPWARSADIRRLPDGLALTCRHFLGRAPSLRMDSRARLGTELAARLTELVFPAPPPGTHPEVLIAAVISERSRRELDLEMRRQARLEKEDARVTALPYGLTDA